MTFINVHEEHKAKDGFYRDGDSFIFIRIEFEMLQVFQLEQVKD